MRYSSLSIQGRRANNEDVVFTRFDPHYPLIAAVSDGMGGHAAGEVASRISIEALDTWTRELCDAPQNVLVDAFFNANAQVLTASESDSYLKGMGATLVAAIFYHDHFITANIGDSRLYHVSGDEIRQVTFDHSYVQELVRRGFLSAEEAKTHPRKNVITRCIGSESSFEPDVFYTRWNPKDTVLLCSDGLCDVLSEADILSEVQKKQDLDELCHTLVEQAYDRGSQDNISLVIVRNEGGVEL
ncbi:MAG: Stp1/IreP family PP2C-type Ser/Thr phosphatase [Clostridia bacterium]|nr:Stp1/IreP family PP2C-type Ser/Thr phosphatase [Clostridia bacterium]MBQ3487769.1 Stp1/IreP family PP2C-type Ser/Thr phosphatase [Clostridia bacterium]MBQ6866961.1 Stp1/IreP family PP2C-type Ser/Thr phosphatase [Clostridia bacterium]MBQ7754721.1 Stp1/IreP family PP2C-type Ser/Thr phosphatase [Clostridia bacterium]MBR0422621.1 Stp1/IreP family PP2C-type Ser/Thr phosphatase [Clostridia bacterium]